MDAAIVVATIAAIAATVGGALTYLGSRRATDDSRAINLINAGQAALESALERQTVELVDTRAEVVRLRMELQAVHVELSAMLRRHEECERQRAADARELAELRKGA